MILGFCHTPKIDARTWMFSRLTDLEMIPLTKGVADEVEPGLIIDMVLMHLDLFA